MIITLKGADFSKSNIGQLSVWRINTDLGDGAVYDGPTSVEKGAALSATVTVDEAYTLGTVTITMAGVALTDGFTIEGNVVTIDIAEVTGTVVISVATGGVAEQCVFTINPTPADATVTLNGVVQNTVTVESGASVSWQVEADGYVTQSGTETVTSDTTKDVVLNEVGSEDTWTEVLYTDDLTLNTANPTNSGATFAALGRPIEANTPISVIDIIQNDGVTKQLTNVNIFVGNADTGEVTEHIVQGESVALTTSGITGKPVGRFVVNKTYDYPVFLAVNADRVGSGAAASGVWYGTDPAGSVHWFAGTAPAIGDVITASAAYAPYIAVYSY